MADTRIRVRPKLLPVDAKQPFAVDLFGRKEFAEALTKIVSNAFVDEHNGLVIAIDGDWGAGKTTFLRQWKAQIVGNSELGDAHERFVYLDAFQADAIDDPFASMVAAVDAAFFSTGGEGRRVKKKAREALRRASLAVAKSAVRVGIGVATAGVSEIAAQGLVEFFKATGDADKKDSIGDVADAGRDKFLETGDASEISERLSRGQKLSELTKKYREALANVAKEVREKHGGPVIFVVDELDRCRPTFAVNFIETARQFFDVTDIVFVLMMHKRQICDAICHVYGSGVDAPRYLQKFVHVDLKLPTYGEHSSRKHYIRFSEGMANQFEIWNSIRSIDANVEPSDVKLMAEAIGEFCYFSNMSLREIERIYGSISLLVLTLAREMEINKATAGRDNPRLGFSVSLASALACLRYCDEPVYRKIVIDEELPDPREIQFFKRRQIVPSLSDPLYNALLWFLSCSTEGDAILEHFWSGDGAIHSKVRNDSAILVEHWGGSTDSLEGLARQYAIYLDTVRPNS